ncbi:helix-turn-helix transcriptional regulator [Colwellia sp. 4_MG-2023]|jgi:AraC-like DNA-binding protein|uniref:AraC family transcriptional regulator n=1 Tax=unclassified Colwellia TaxID=196834 RepID=UPI0026E2D987|nr:MULTISPECIES: helix-turn-helix transcriptional regulator [unclassified Colwellia]MDO6508849.1 helix-turn-helix transcriptional regulator [Colwellia sp. 5_MG-2023]MDO6557529.1 helix-turn-helix transcriptional regulator [Colwellia sp. 4_MG-2023]
MPELIAIAPSKESEQELNNPITVVSRAITMNSVVIKHKHSWGQFVYAHSGVLAVSTPLNRYIVPPEQGVWLLPEVEHEVTAISDVQLTSFYFDVTLLDALPDECCVLNVNDFLKALIKEANNIKSDYQWNSTDGRLLYLILDRLTLAPNEIFQLPYPKDHRLITLLREIQASPENNNTLGEWGNIVGASARTLSRLFKKETGLSYSEWRQRLNIQIAITQLSLGKSITSISLHLGYESPSSFIHMFRTKTGITPSFYRENKRNW